MGCDFYITKYLEIEHKNGVSYYSLKLERGWYSYGLGVDWDNSDSEETDDEDTNGNKKKYMEKEMQKLWKDMIRLYLTPREPLVLYENGKFISEKVQEKYSKLLQDKINGIYIDKYVIYRDTGSFNHIEDIIRVTKKEVRHEVGEGPGMYRSDGKSYSDNDDNDDDDDDDMTE